VLHHYKQNGYVSFNQGTTRKKSTIGKKIKININTHKNTNTYTKNTQ
jgi:hypothetical protein